MRTHEESRPYGKIVHIGDEPRDGEPMPPFLVDGIICRSLTLVYGEPGAGKSTMMAALTIALANGEKPFLGQAIYATGPIRVGVITGDPKEDQRYEALLQGMVPEGQVYYHPDAPASRG
jgi:AAA domain-containing protein